MIRKFGGKKEREDRKRLEERSLLDVFSIFLNNVFGNHGKSGSRF